MQLQTTSPVHRMFDGRSVLVTGATGFIGRVLLEKLLRTYCGLRTVYILLRAKKSISPDERLRKHILDCPIFNQIKSMKNGRQLLDKLVVVSGDIGEPSLGISKQDLEMLLNDTSLSIVFHAAATIKFDEPIQLAIKYNLKATRVVLDLCRRMKNLAALCHVSTAYVNSDIKDGSVIEEKLYPMRQKPQDIIQLADFLDDEALQAIKQFLIGERPNTYTYTKALAEHLIASEARDLPVAIVRPSIVIASWKEPLPGWVDNLNGPTGLTIATGQGLLRSLHVSKSSKADLVPVDLVVNTMIASAYYVAKTNFGHANGVTDEQQRKEPNKRPVVFHCTSGMTNPITWGTIGDLIYPIVRQYPSERLLRYPNGSFKSNQHLDLLSRLFAHYLPALVADLLGLLVGRRPILISIYAKLHRAIGSLSHFTKTEYNFESKNLHSLESCLIGRDKAELYLDMRCFEWSDVWRKYYLGARRYILKESDSSLYQTRKSLKRIYCIEIGIYMLLVALVAVLLSYW